MERDREHVRSAFDGWKYRHYFQFDSVKNDKNISVRCTLCVGRKLLSAAKNSTSNLSKHLANRHGNVKLTESPTGITAAAANVDSTSDGPTASKQVKIDVKPAGLGAAELKKLVAGCVVEEMLPISTVDSESFRRIIDKIPTKSGVKLPQRKSFSEYLEREYDIMNSNLKATLEEVDFVSTTAHIWTVNNKSFLGVTVHWINSTLQRNKAALACKRIKGSHTFDVIGAEIEEIHSTYGLHGKVVATVTDNASNFAKAFRVYQSCDLESESEKEDDEEEPTFTDVINVLSAPSTEGQFSLPPHYRCASHTINLISTSDVEKHLNSSAETKSVYRSSMAKCSALWTKTSRSTLAAEQVEEISYRKLMVPTSTRWNSLYEAISRILTIPSNELNPLCVKLGIKCFTEKEYQFLKEYISVMKPLTVALDILQGDECTYGALLPTLTSLMSKTLALKDDLSKMTATLPDVIVKAIKTRFNAVLESQEGRLAAATCPKFKLRWLRDECSRVQVKELLITECRTTAAATADVPQDSQPPASPDEMDFFDFEIQPRESLSAENEVTDYIRSGHELEILNQFPTVKKIYMKYNTPTPSSAPVERLFSLGGLVLSPKRNRLSDRRFEKLLLMRYNHCFTPKENKTSGKF
uniref:HAT C-terminal dimerisation domain-containing protein n=2 Tax=Nothobranchius pienaari TaxID=704102 RepID=A0A1A8L117_9TELE